MGPPSRLELTLAPLWRTTFMGLPTEACALRQRKQAKVGGRGEDRTPDLCIANAALSQLSYAPHVWLDRTETHGRRPVRRHECRFYMAFPRRAIRPGWLTMRKRTTLTPSLNDLQRLLGHQNRDGARLR